ncbi:hypothetical protein ABIE71_009067 [Bradyrhizobium diazoefficiens]
MSWGVRWDFDFGCIDAICPERMICNGLVSLSGLGRYWAVARPKRFEPPPLRIVDGVDASNRPCRRPRAEGPP